ncbi:hypothetical protein [Sorangium sp. So ce1389]|uniref:hypothetical protein n=1 Tax=Sorangium sp. So ce1389 TaxID=3133336 RepID=UPI003F61358A
MRVGVICEGSTDFAIIEALALELIQADECVLLQPSFDRLQAGDTSIGTGWQAVRKFLRQSGPALGLGVYDVIVVQVDASVRLVGEVQRQLRERSDDEPELAPLCEHVRGWANGTLPSTAVVALPREEIENWLLAAHTNLRSVEAFPDAAEVLAERGLIARRKNGDPDKDANRYRALAAPLVRLAGQPRRRRHVAELDRFVCKLLAVARVSRIRR